MKQKTEFQGFKDYGTAKPRKNHLWVSINAPGRSGTDRARDIFSGNSFRIWQGKTEKLPSQNKQIGGKNCQRADFFLNAFSILWYI